MSKKDAKARGLGRGLSALMSDIQPVGDTSAPSESRAPDMMVPVEKLIANKNQPRRRFIEDELESLTASIRTKGIIQPLIVRPKGEDTYEIVAGERRWRAAQRAQLHDVPVIVRDFNDSEVLEVAIIENIQRADLNPVEEAAGYRQLMDVFGHTQEKLAEALGKSRSHIANVMRLLGLPDDVQEMLQDGRLTTGHARALITSEDPSKLAQKVVNGAMSVRQTEALVKKAQKPAAPKPQSAEKDADTRALEDDLSANLGMVVNLTHKPGQESGQVTIKYATFDDLDRICRLLSAS